MTNQTIAKLCFGTEQIVHTAKVILLDPDTEEDMDEATRLFVGNILEETEKLTRHLAKLLRYKQNQMMEGD